MSRHSPLSREVVNLIRTSRERDSTIARQLGISRQTVAKIRSGQIHQGQGDDEAREELVRDILSRSPLETHAAIAQQLNLHRETVRKVRFGQQWADVLPDLSRLDPAASGAYCYLCCHWDPGREPGVCTLGIPEAALDGHLYARGCGAYQGGQP